MHKSSLDGVSQELSLIQEFLPQNATVLEGIENYRGFQYSANASQLLQNTVVRIALKVVTSGALV